MQTTLFTGTLFLLTAGGALAQSPQPPVTTPSPAPAQPAQPPATTPPPAPVAPLRELAPAPTIDSSTLPDVRPFDMSGPRYWATGEYLLAWYNPMRTVPLIQTVPSALAQSGMSLGSNATTIFPEGNRIDFGAFNGARVTVGADWEKFGVEVSGFLLQRQTDADAAFNNGTPVAIARSYISAGSGAPTSLFTSLPNRYSGGAYAVAQSRLWGGDVNFRREWYAFLCDSAQLLIGFKYLNLTESLGIDSPAFFPSGGTLDVRDSIGTRNDFYGTYVGYHAQIGGFDRGLGFDFTAKSGLGGVDQRVELVGSNTFVSPAGAANTESGGLYARGLNSGTFTRTRAAYMQDLDLKVTYNFNRYVQVSFGYSLQYLSSVVRAGSQIDPVVNDSTIRYVAMPTPSNADRPAFAWRASDFAVNGLTFGLRVQY